MRFKDKKGWLAQGSDYMYIGKANSNPTTTANIITNWVSNPKIKSNHIRKENQRANI